MPIFTQNKKDLILESKEHLQGVWKCVFTDVLGSGTYEDKENSLQEASTKERSYVHCRPTGKNPGSLKEVENTSEESLACHTENGQT